ncbi:hypothetical protein [Haloarcula sp. JP-L23]|uniref:hypothetical protein n=1 Tax=Haloarcula sp. JP-L23 TaxID=2716717 RepID=UPI00140F0A87|nr:hypothetical protein G9465_01850 [Haloarcula sp. JP-L23]
MKRRSYLALLSTALGAGCVSPLDSTGPDGRQPDGTGTEATPASPSSAERSTDADDASGPTRVVETIAVGTREGVENPGDNLPHDVAVWNAGSSAREIAVSVRAADDGPSLERRDEYAADTARRFELLTPAPYTVEIRVPVDGRQTTVGVDRNWFDCNSASHRIRVPGVGPITSTVSSTLLACPRGTVTES